MKKTLLVTLDFYPALGGVSNYWIALSEQMPSHQWVVLASPIITPDIKELGSAYQIYRYPFYSSRMWPRWLPLIFALVWVILRERPKAVIAAQVLPVGTAVSFISWIFGIPYIVSTHGMDVTMPFRDSGKRNLCKKIFSKAKTIITVSRYTAKKIKEYGVKESKIQFVYPCPAIVPKESSVPFPSSSKESIILTVGRLVQRKGHEYVIDAIPGLKEYDPPIQYVVVGDGPQKENLIRYAKERGVADRVLFTGSLPDMSVAQWYKKCDIFIMTPYEIDGDLEGFGIVYLEANSFGKAVIGTRTGGVQDAVLDGVTGILVESQDVSAIREAIVNLLSNKLLSQRLGEQGKKRVKKEFQWSVQAEKLQNIISEI